MEERPRTVPLTEDEVPSIQRIQNVEEARTLGNVERRLRNPTMPERRSRSKLVIVVHFVMRRFYRTNTHLAFGNQIEYFFLL